MSDQVQIKARKQAHVVKDNKKVETNNLDIFNHCPVHRFPFTKRGAKRKGNNLNVVKTPSLLPLVAIGI